MLDIGLQVVFDGVNNIVMEEGVVKEYPIGGLICEYARLKPTEIKPIILKCPLFKEKNFNGKINKAMLWLFNALKKRYGIVTSVMVITDFSNFIADYKKANTTELSRLLAQSNRGIKKDKIKQFILQDTGYDMFGIQTVGQALLTAYSTYAISYVVFKKSFMMLTAEEFDKNAVSGFLSLYGENYEMQHIDFSIILYEKSFHSIYNIKSSMSLLLFEIAHSLNNNTKFVKCKNCGEYFVPTGRVDSLYCGYPSPQNKEKACRDIGAQATRAKKMKNDIVTQEYRRLYMRLKMAIKRHPDNEILKKQLQKLTSEMKKLRDKKASTKISADDILEWIQKEDENCGKLEKE